jgi:uncharacterized BrkB/YihY/UPF0761 family membrane protein
MKQRWTKLTKTIPSRLRARSRDTTTLVKDYLLQETLDPLRALGRYVAFGTLGSLLVGIGALFWLIAVLRLLQGETGAFDGNLSWLPYVIVAVLGLLVMAATAWRIVSGPARKRSARHAKGK